MAIVRFTDAGDNITLGSDATFLGQGGDDTYIFDPNLIPANATIEIADNEGVNTLRFPDGLEIESSIVATLSDGGVALQLTLTNGTTIFVDRADEFDFQIGGDTGGNGSTDQTITEFVEETLGTTIPAPGGSNEGGPVNIGINTPPVANDDGFGTNEKNARNISDDQLLDNDTDADGDTLSVVSVDASGLQGVLTDNGDGTYTYDPNGQFDSLQVGESATDTFSYTVSDGNGATDTATVTVTINGVNDAPVAVDDTGSTGEKDTLLITAAQLLGNDTDVEDDPLSVFSLSTSGLQGTLTDNGNGTYTYDPNGQFDSLQAGETATDTFSYTVSDGNGGFDTATVRVTIDGENDAPVAGDDDVSTDEDSDVQITAASLLANDTDVDGGPLSIESVDDSGLEGTLIDNGDGSYTYDPNDKFENLQVGETATDTFSYTVSDGNGGTDTATVTVTIDGVNDAPEDVDFLESGDKTGDVNEFDGAGTVVGTFVTDDPDDTDSHTYQFVGGTGSDIFEVVGNQLVVKDGVTIPDVTDDETRTVIIRATDSFGATTGDITFEVTLNNLINEGQRFVLTSDIDVVEGTANDDIVTGQSGPGNDDPGAPSDIKTANAGDDIDTEDGKDIVRITKQDNGSDDGIVSVSGVTVKQRDDQNERYDGAEQVIEAVNRDDEIVSAGEFAGENTLHLDRDEDCEAEQVASTNAVSERPDWLEIEHSEMQDVTGALVRQSVNGVIHSDIQRYWAEFGSQVEGFGSENWQGGLAAMVDHDADIAWFDMDRQTFTDEDPEDFRSVNMYANEVNISHLIFSQNAEFANPEASDINTTGQQSLFGAEADEITTLNLLATQDGFPFNFNDDGDSDLVPLQQIVIGNIQNGALGEVGYDGGRPVDTSLTTINIQAQNTPPVDLNDVPAATRDDADLVGDDGKTFRQEGIGSRQDDLNDPNDAVDPTLLDTRAFAPADVRGGVVSADARSFDMVLGHVIGIGGALGGLTTIDASTSQDRDVNGDGVIDPLELAADIFLQIARPDEIFDSESELAEGAPDLTATLGAGDDWVQFQTEVTVENDPNKMPCEDGDFDPSNASEDGAFNAGSETEFPDLARNPYLQATVNGGTGIDTFGLDNEGTGSSYIGSMTVVTGVERLETVEAMNPDTIIDLTPFNDDLSLARINGVLGDLDIVGYEGTLTPDYPYVSNEFDIELFQQCTNDGVISCDLNPEYGDAPDSGFELGLEQDGGANQRTNLFVYLNQNDELPYEEPLNYLGEFERDAEFDSDSVIDQIVDRDPSNPIEMLQIDVDHDDNVKDDDNDGDPSLDIANVLMSGLETMLLTDRNTANGEIRISTDRKADPAGGEDARECAFDPCGYKAYEVFVGGSSFVDAPVAEFDEEGESYVLETGRFSAGTRSEPQSAALGSLPAEYGSGNLIRVDNGTDSVKDDLSLEVPAGSGNVIDLPTLEPGESLVVNVGNASGPYRLLDGGDEVDARNSVQTDPIPSEEFKWVEDDDPGNTDSLALVDGTGRFPNEVDRENAQMARTQNPDPDQSTYNQILAQFKPEEFECEECPEEQSSRQSQPNLNQYWSGVSTGVFTGATINPGQVLLFQTLIENSELELRYVSNEDVPDTLDPTTDDIDQGNPEFKQAAVSGRNGEVTADVAPGVPEDITAGLAWSSRAFIPGFFQDGSGGAILHGEGNDQSVGQEGDDRLEGNGGNDILLGQAGDDLLLGGAGRDVLQGGEDRDYVNGQDGRDRARGDEGDDLVIGGSDGSRDTLFGNDGDDIVRGGDNDAPSSSTTTAGDYLSGGNNDDYLEGKTGSDILVGGNDDTDYSVFVRRGTDLETDNETSYLDPVDRGDVLDLGKGNDVAIGDYYTPEECSECIVELTGIEGNQTSGTLVGEDDTYSIEVTTIEETVSVSVTGSEVSPMTLGEVAAELAARLEAQGLPGVEACVLEGDPVQIAVKQVDGEPITVTAEASDANTSPDLPPIQEIVQLSGLENIAEANVIGPGDTYTLTVDFDGDGDIVPIVAPFTAVGNETELQVLQDLAAQLEAQDDDGMNGGGFSWAGGLTDPFIFRGYTGDSEKAGCEVTVEFTGFDGDPVDVPAVGDSGKITFSDATYDADDEITFSLAQGANTPAPLTVRVGDLPGIVLDGNNQVTGSDVAQVFEEYLDTNGFGGDVSDTNSDDLIAAPFDIALGVSGNMVTFDATVVEASAEFNVDATLSDGPAMPQEWGIAFLGEGQEFPVLLPLEEGDTVQLTLGVDADGENGIVPPDEQTIVNVTLEGDVSAAAYYEQIQSEIVEAIGATLAANGRTVTVPATAGLIDDEGGDVQGLSVKGPVDGNGFIEWQISDVSVTPAGGFDDATPPVSVVNPGDTDLNDTPLMLGNAVQDNAAPVVQNQNFRPGSQLENYGLGEEGIALETIQQGRKPAEDDSQAAEVVSNQFGDDWERGADTFIVEAEEGISRANFADGFDNDYLPTWNGPDDADVPAGPDADFFGLLSAYRSSETLPSNVARNSADPDGTFDFGVTKGVNYILDFNQGGPLSVSGSDGDPFGGNNDGPENEGSFTRSPVGDGRPDGLGNGPDEGGDFLDRPGVAFDPFESDKLAFRKLNGEIDEAGKATNYAELEGTSLFRDDADALAEDAFASNSNLRYFAISNDGTQGLDPFLRVYYNDENSVDSAPEAVAELVGLNNVKLQFDFNDITGYDLQEDDVIGPGFRLTPDSANTGQLPDALEFNSHVLGHEIREADGYNDDFYVSQNTYDQMFDGVAGVDNGSAPDDDTSELREFDPRNPDTLFDLDLG